MGFISTGRKYAVAYAGRRYGPVAGRVLESLLAKTKKAARAQATAAPVLKGTKLKSYLDRTYERKCGVEIKQYEVVQSATIGTTLAAVFNPLEGQIIQGLTDQNRIGSKIELKDIRLRFTFSAMAASTGPCRVRIIVLKLQSMNGSNPAASQILETGTNIRSAYTNDNDITRTYQIVKDKVIKLSALSSGDSDVAKDWNWVYRPKGCHEVEWTSSDTTGLLANMTKGNFVVYMMYESLPTSGQAPVFNVYSRIGFADP